MIYVIAEQHSLPDTSGARLLKTFWGGPGGWRDEQLPDGTVVWTPPGRQA